jgi:hypothetical protein
VQYARLQTCRREVVFYGSPAVGAVVPEDQQVRLSDYCTFNTGRTEIKIGGGHLPRLVRFVCAEEMNIDHLKWTDFCIVHCSHEGSSVQ